MVKKFLRLAVSAALAGTLATSALAQETIKVGLLMSYSGIALAGGVSADNIIKQFQSRYGSEPGGKKIEIVLRDDTGNAEVTRRCEHLLESST